MPENRPVDLTTMGAATELPPLSHSIYSGPLKSASDGFPDLNMTKEWMAFRIVALERQMAKLAAALGVDLDAG